MLLWVLPFIYVEEEDIAQCPLYDKLLSNKTGEFGATKAGSHHMLG